LASKDSVSAREDVLRRTPSVTLMGLRLDNLAEDEVVERIVSDASLGLGGWLANPNVDRLRQIVAQPALRQLVEGASLVVPDGMPLIWASRLQGTPLKARVPMSETIETLSAAAVLHGVGLFLLGGAPTTAERASRLLAGRYPGLRVSHLCPPLGFEHNDDAMAAICEALKDASPGVVFCAFGCPKEEHLMALLHERFPAVWFVSVGGTFSIVVGDTPKAAPWMRRTGLEWAHRLRLEPRRLFSRYIVHDAPFALRLLGWSALARFRRAAASTAAVPERRGA